MNILILNWRDTKNPKAGGAEIVTLEHAKAWVKAGHSVVWFTSGFKNAINKEFINGIEVIRRGNVLTVYFLAPIFYLFSGRKFDVIVDEIHGLPFFTPFYSRKPIVAYIHEVADEIWDYMYGFPINAIGKLLEPVFFKLYSKLYFWTPSESTIQDLVKHGIPRNDCINIPCAINNSVLKTLPQKEKEPTFIFVSRVVRMKGVETVIDAFSLIKQQEINAKLWIIGRGDPDYITVLKKEIEKRGLSENVTFYGHISEEKKLSLMRRAHLLLHASVKEGWGLVVIEAASQGTPSVVYNVAGLRDSVQNNRTGIVLAKNSPEYMAAESLQLYHDKKKYHAFQKNCFTFARSFSWKDSTAMSLDLLKKLVYEKKN